MEQYNIMVMLQNSNINLTYLPGVSNESIGLDHVDPLLLFLFHLGNFD